MLATLTALCVVLAACASAPTTGPLSAPALMKHVAVLAAPELDGRAAGSPGERQAARYVAEQLRLAGLEVREQTVRSANSINVYAMIAGNSEEMIVVGAHLDHLGRQGGRLYPGADDNASGVAVLLGLARTLAERRGELGRSVMLVAFGAEESGMIGSRHFVANPPVALAQIRAMVNLDMIGRPMLDQRLFRPALHLVGIDRDRAVGLVGARRYPALREIADEAFAAHDVQIVAAEDVPERIGREVDAQAQGRSDSVAFEERGIPALFFGDGESRDYHRPSDTIDRLAPAVLERRARALARVVLDLSRAPAEAFATSEAVPPKRVPPRGWYAPFGLSNGLSLHPGAGYFLGGELAIVRLWPDSLTYAGVYADALHDTATGTQRLSIGPELGRMMFGIDGGYVVELDDGFARDGFALRPFVTLSVLALTARVGYFRDGDWFGELGVSIKYPLRVRTSWRRN